MSKQFPDRSLPWPIPMEAVELIAQAESLRLTAYRCPAGIPTIGWGHTGPDVVIGETVWTKEQADKILCDELTEFADGVRKRCAQAPTANQLGALTSLAYNIGIGGLAGSTVLKRHNAGDWQAAARAFGLWNKAKVGGQLVPLAGLTSRRAAEAALYLKAEHDAPPVEMPQAVESESGVSASPIVRSGVASAATGVIAILSDAGDALGGLSRPISAAKTFLVETVGLPTSSIPYLVAIGVGVAVVYWRLRQRREGWA